MDHDNRNYTLSVIPPKGPNRPWEPPRQIPWWQRSPWWKRRRPFGAAPVLQEQVPIPDVPIDETIDEPEILQPWMPGVPTKTVTEQKAYNVYLQSLLKQKVWTPIGYTLPSNVSAPVADTVTYKMPYQSYGVDPGRELIEDAPTEDEKKNNRTALYVTGAALLLLLMLGSGRKRR